MVASVPGIVTARAILSLASRRLPVPLFALSMLSLCCDIVEAAEPDAGRSGFADFGGSKEGVVKGFDKEDVAGVFVVDGYAVDRLAGAGALKLSVVGLLQSDFPFFNPQHLQT